MTHNLNIIYSIGLSDFCVEPANYIEETVLKADWLNQNEIKFFFKCDDEHPKFRKIQKLSLDLEGKKVFIISGSVSFYFRFQVNILSLMSKSNSMHSKIQNSLATKFGISKQPVTKSRPDIFSPQHDPLFDQFFLDFFA